MRPSRVKDNKHAVRKSPTKNNNFQEKVSRMRSDGWTVIASLRIESA